MPLVAPGSRHAATTMTSKGERSGSHQLRSLLNSIANAMYNDKMCDAKDNDSPKTGRIGSFENAVKYEVT